MYLVYAWSTILMVMVNTSTAARILGFIPTPSYSHQIAFRPIWKELSLRGHEVVSVTTDPIWDSSLKNLTEIDTSFSYNEMKELMEYLAKSGADNTLKFTTVFLQFADKMSTLCINQLNCSGVRNLLEDENEHFDLVMIEILHPVMLAFAKRFNCPVIGLMSLDANTFAHKAIGNPINPSLYPDIMLPFDGTLSFTERVLSSAYVIFMEYVNKVVVSPSSDQTVRDFFGKDYPPVNEMLKNIDMLFLNSNPVLGAVRPIVPAVVYFGGGTHLDTPKKLPNELQNYLDGAKDGFIYFSLGSNIKSKDIPESSRKVIIQTLAALPYKILWKFEADDLPGKPENVKIMKWLPQQDVLRHPNIKLFITQGGLQSMEEAIFINVPMLVMPFMADQDNNAKKVVSKGFGLTVDYKTVTQESLKEAILEIINNPKYRNEEKRIAELVLDQPMTGIEKVVWWTEYVLRHKGAKHLRSPAIDMPLYQYLLLDVLGFIFIVFFIMSFIIYKIFRYLLGSVRSLISRPKLKVN